MMITLAKKMVINNITKPWVNDGPALNVKKYNARNMDNDKQNHDTNI